MKFCGRRLGLGRGAPESSPGTPRGPASPSNPLVGLAGSLRQAARRSFRSAQGSQSARTQRLPAPVPRRRLRPPRGHGSARPGDLAVPGGVPGASGDADAGVFPRSQQAEPARHLPPAAESQAGATAAGTAPPPRLPVLWPGRDHSLPPSLPFPASALRPSPASPRLLPHPRPRRGRDQEEADRKRQSTRAAKGRR